ncbi:MAG: NADH-quinone oxidoreductase subunit H [Deltaproteobacteria bacterium]|nr:NADH-quinone oxidoreductase subunit H [Deltaproteobacteria bacterium]MCX7952147.1 NADH-quinone oxidoreductase subunit H [Deltaproteobacteria bacterium]
MFADSFFLTVFFTGVILNIAFSLTLMNIWFERKVSALMQDRLGANRAGLDLSLPRYLFFLRPFVFLFAKLGLFNTLFCDPVKAITKEDFKPSRMSALLHGLAPWTACFPIFLCFAFLPLGPKFSVGQATYNTQLISTDLDLLVVIALTTVAVYGTTLAGWVSGSKYAFLGALRASAQMLSYELILGLTLLATAIWYETANLYAIGEAQKNLWGIFVMPLGFLLMFVAGMAETKRGPFDLAESESELVAGYFTEYSGMKFLLFWFGEFAEIALLSFLLAICFLGGWDLPFVSLKGDVFGFLLGHLSLMVKVVFLCLIQIVIRWTLPRFRYDQLMKLCWKYLLPLAIINVLMVLGLKWLS